MGTTTMQPVFAMSTNAIHQQAIDTLVNNPHLRQRRLSLKTVGERVVLKGTVNSFFEKQIAQESLKQVPGIKGIDNQLEVSWPMSSSIG
jgi:osmotically-inducible protein OsmY